jgi:dCTP deaminase
MILSNVEIVKGLDAGYFCIDNIAGTDPSLSPFNTSAVDLRLGPEILVPEVNPVQIDLRQPGIATYWAKNSTAKQISPDQGYSLEKGKLVLARTIERVAFPLFGDGQQCYSARVEGRSSLARCGVLIHFTAPTIHAGFEETITLEIINMGETKFLLFPGMFICQLIIEEVKGCPIGAPNQFKGQDNPAGVVKK